MGTLALILVPAAIFVGAVALALTLSRGRAEEPGRPWWGNPAVWVAASAVGILLGVFVFPRLLGFTFLFLPLLWFRGFGRRGQDQGRRSS